MDQSVSVSESICPNFRAESRHGPEFVVPEGVSLGGQREGTSTWRVCSWTAAIAEAMMPHDDPLHRNHVRLAPKSAAAAAWASLLGNFHQNTHTHIKGLVIPRMEWFGDDDTCEGLSPDRSIC